MSVWEYCGYLLAAISGGYFVWEVRRVFFTQAIEPALDWFVAADLVMAFALSLLLAWAGWESFARPPEPLKLEVIQGGYLVQAFFVALILSYLHFRKIPLRPFFNGGSWSGWKTVGLSLAILAAMLPFVLGVANLLSHSDADDQEVVRFFASHPKLADRAWVVVLAAVVAPFAEELLFRGFLYRIFRQFFGKVSAAFFTAVLFGLIHGNLAALFPLMLLAIVLTIGLERSGSLFVPMIMHAAFNSVTLLALWLFPNL